MIQEIWVFSLQGKQYILCSLGRRCLIFHGVAGFLYPEVPNSRRSRDSFADSCWSWVIHATRPFVVNEWIQTKIEGYEVSGTIEHVGWWSPTIVRVEDREAVHIPNHKFTVNVVRNFSQKTHWRIKTHLAISHLDVNKINNIAADMCKCHGSKVES